MTLPVCTIDATGIHTPTFEDVVVYLKDGYTSIYGSDVYLENDSQDGQLLELFASAINDANSQCVAAYNAFSPSTAQGVGLSTVVKINGIARTVPTNSQVDLRVVGVAGTIILNGVVGPEDGSSRWSLPASVTVPIGGEITVTALCQTIGDVAAAPDTLQRILTPTRGWQTVTNLAAATPGDPVETDALLRQRQTVSTAIPSETILDGLIGAIATLSGVTRYQAYENDTNATDGNGIPGHSISMVVEGGDAAEIASTIAIKKTPGAGTYGTTSVEYTDTYGNVETIRFFRPTQVGITSVVTIHNLTGYTSVVGSEIKAAVVAAINGLPIGQDVFYTRLYVPAQLAGPYAAPSSPVNPSTFELISVEIARDADPVAAADVEIAFNEAAMCTEDDVTLVVV